MVDCEGTTVSNLPAQVSIDEEQTLRKRGEMVEGEDSIEEDYFVQQHQEVEVEQQQMLISLVPANRAAKRNTTVLPATSSSKVTNRKRNLNNESELQACSTSAIAAPSHP